MPLSPAELIIIAVAILFFTGGSQLPKLARSLRDARHELTDTDT